MQDFSSTLSADASMRSLANAIEKAGMAVMLRDAGPYTLFAPNDEAFTRMNNASLPDSAENLKSALSCHLVVGKYTFNDIQRLETQRTENGKSLTIALDEGELVVNCGKFAKTDIDCSNGTIQIIDNVFQPYLSGWYREE